MTTTFLLPRDIPDIQTTAYAMGMGIVLNTYPDIHADAPTIEAVAHANLDVGLPTIHTNDKKALTEAYCSSFCLGYIDASNMFKEKPDFYKRLVSLTDDEQIAACTVIAREWYTFMQEKIVPSAIRRVRYRVKRNKRKYKR